MNISELVNNDKSKIEFFDSLIEELDRNGLGTLSKADFEAFIYNLFCKYMNNDKVMSNFDWIKYLKVTPSKLKSMQRIASIKYQNFDDSIENWNMFISEISKSKIEIDDIEKGNIKLLLSNEHTRLFIENFLNNLGITLDYSRNRSQMIIKLENFLIILDKIESKLYSEKEIEDWKLNLKDQIKEEYSNELKELFKVNKNKSTVSSFLMKTKDKFLNEGSKFVLNSLISEIFKMNLIN